MSPISRFEPETRNATNKVSRRSVLLAMGGAALTAGVIDGVLIEPDLLETVVHHRQVAGLSSNLNGLCVAQITDLHLNKLGKLHDRILQALSKQRPNLIVITGDSIDDPSKLSVLRDFCSALRGNEHRTVAISGNWEHWGKIAVGDLVAAYRDCDVKWLGNESEEIAGLSLSATDDYCAGESAMWRTLRNRRVGQLNLLLTHSPQLLDEESDNRVKFDLCLAGHTHGGQLTVLGRKILTPPGSGRFVQGFYDTQHGPAYVSRGIGTSVIAARLMCRPELAFFQFWS